MSINLLGIYQTLCRTDPVAVNRNILLLPLRRHGTVLHNCRRRANALPIENKCVRGRKNGKCRVRGNTTVSHLGNNVLDTP